MRPGMCTSGQKRQRILYWLYGSRSLDVRCSWFLEELKKLWAVQGARASFSPCCPSKLGDRPWSKTCLCRSWTTVFQAASISLLELLFPSSHIFSFLACGFQPDHGTYMRGCCTVGTALAGFFSPGALGWAGCLLSACSEMIQHNKGLWTELWGSPVKLILKPVHMWIKFKNTQTNRKAISLVLHESYSPKVTKHIKEPATHEKNILRRKRNLL